MSVLFVVNRLEDWPFEIAGASVTTARGFLTEAEYTDHAERVINLCRCDRYQGRGYYVSLLAEARRQRPVPDIKTLEDLQSEPLVRLLAGRIAAQMESTLPQDAARIELDCYFGHDPSGHHPAVTKQLFALVKAPLLRARFERRNGHWTLALLQALSAGEVPPQYRDALALAAAEYVTGQAVRRTHAGQDERPALAILYNPDEPEPPSNPLALEKMQAAGARLGMRVEIIGRHDIDRLGGFDALFIRDTTNVGHYTYEFSRRALTEGLVVMDDPDSILQCTNKVYLNELMSRHRIPVPKTLMVHRDNVDQIVPTLGLPCILKQPDSAFSLGVAKVETQEQLKPMAEQLLEHSELIIAQQWLPTAFDWRVTILDRRPLFVCQYFMAPGHWQIIKREPAVRVEGHATALSVGETPEIVVKTALRAANLIGNGLYGVDLKQVGDQCYLIEVNDNPNIDAGNEDAVLQDALYRELMGVFLRRIQERRRRMS
jgi:glutathione synthase/RimK-type ligase-like ATP-grasp enzyme